MGRAACASVGISALHSKESLTDSLCCFSCVKITGSVGSKVLTIKLFAKTNMPIEDCLSGSPGCERPLLGQWPIFMGLESPWGCVGMARNILTPVNRCSCGGLLPFAASSHVSNLVSGGGSSEELFATDAKITHQNS